MELEKFTDTYSAKSLLESAKEGDVYLKSHLLDDAPKLRSIVADAIDESKIQAKTMGDAQPIYVRIDKFNKFTIEKVVDELEKLGWRTKTIYDYDKEDPTELKFWPRTYNEDWCKLN